MNLTTRSPLQIDLHVSTSASWRRFGCGGSSVASDGSAGAVGGGNTSRRRQRLVIYQRNTDRRLLDLEGNVETLRELLGPDWDLVPIVHDNAHEPCWLYSQLMDADMLLTPHG